MIIAGSSLLWLLFFGIKVMTMVAQVEDGVHSSYLALVAGGRLCQLKRSQTIIVEPKDNV
jgi:hypothetical protein